MKNIIIIILLTCLNINLFAQKLQIKEADLLYKQRAYKYAAEKYEIAFEKNAKNSKLKDKVLMIAKQNAASCYRLIKDTRKAEIYYFDVIQYFENGKKDVEPDVLFYYARMLQSNGFYKDAISYFNKYLEVGDANRINAKYIEKLEKLLKMRNIPVQYREKPIRTNSSASDYCPAFYKNGIVFASTRNRKKENHFTWTGEPFSEIYFTDGTTVKSLAKTINSKLNEGVVSFNEDETEMYFSRNNYVDGKAQNSSKNINNLVILSSKFSDKWEKAELLPFNNKRYNCAHPSVVVNEAGETLMFFSSDMPDGQGGMDLYVSRKQGGQWRDPVNLGDKINTHGNDIFPYAFSGDTLYFASDGHPGFGGLDIYKASLNGEEWSQVENMMQGVNSPKDDFGFIKHRKEESGYFSSNRNGDDNIYEFAKNTYLYGKVYDDSTKQLLSHAKLKFYKASMIADSAATKRNGEFSFVYIPENSYNLTVNRNGYFPKDLRLSSQILQKWSNSDTLKIYLKVDKNNDIALNFHFIDSITKQALNKTVINYYHHYIDTTWIDTTESDAMSSFRVDPVYDYKLIINKDYYNTYVFDLPTDSIINYNDNDTIIIEIPPPYVKGIIVDADSLNVLDFAKVELYYSKLKGEIAITEDNGDFVFQVTPNYTYNRKNKVKIERQGYFAKETNIFVELHPKTINTPWNYSYSINKINSDTVSTFVQYKIPTDTTAIIDSTSIRIAQLADSLNCIVIGLVRNPDEPLEIIIEEEEEEIIEIVDDIIEKDSTLVSHEKLRGNYGELFLKDDGEFVIGNIYFDTDKYNISVKSSITLDNLTNYLFDYPKSYLRIRAFADSTATEKYNLGLSGRRAKAAKNYLIHKGINPAKVFFNALGEEPLHNDCPENDIPCLEEALQESRRVEFRIIAPKKVP